MDPCIYKLHIENEQEHWWYKARREIISSIISKFVFKNNKLKILDFGCGIGVWSQKNLKNNFYSR